eukprot:augustus_masked-scaffold_23-processed-gene-5.63-mRNA-1 protein AED:1.00 eAED:1.00 QI:0/-1/0/0/-1/1/1/0/624
MFRFNRKTQIPDTDFEEAWNKYRDWIFELESTSKSLTEYYNTLVAFVEKGSFLGKRLALFAKGSPIESKVRSYASDKLQIEKVQLASITQKFKPDLLFHINVELKKFEDVKKQVKVRKKLLAEFLSKEKKLIHKQAELSALRKEQSTPKKTTNFFASPRQKKTIPEVEKEVEEREQIMKTAKESVDKLTGWLLQEFNDLETKRNNGEIIEPTLSVLLSGEYHFFFKGSEKMNKLLQQFHVSQRISELRSLDQQKVRGLQHNERDVFDRDGLVFGSPLKQSTPQVVCDCIAYIREFVSEEGLFRISGSRERVDQMANEYDSNSRDVLTRNQDINVHDVCSLMKKFLLEMRTPLIPGKDLLNLFTTIALASTVPAQEVWIKIKDIVTNIANPFKGCLGLVLNFLLDVSKYETQNQMNSSNLATCLCPAVCRFADDDPLGAAYSPMAVLGSGIVLLKLLIEKARDFDVPKQESITKSTKVNMDHIKSKKKQIDLEERDFRSMKSKDSSYPGKARNGSLKSQVSDISAEELFDKRFNTARTGRGNSTRKRVVLEESFQEASKPIDDVDLPPSPRLALLEDALQPTVDNIRPGHATIRLDRDLNDELRGDVRQSHSSSLNGSTLPSVLG